VVAVLGYRNTAPQSQAVTNRQVSTKRQVSAAIERHAVAGGGIHLLNDREDSEGACCVLDFLFLTSDHTIS
jgi:hypothetical protein